MIVLIQYNAGNCTSVKYALQRLGTECIVTADPALIRLADKVIFPGVGHAGAAMRYLEEQNLVQVIRNLTQPVLGICLGMQLLCKHAEEGNTTGIGIFDTVVRQFPPLAKVPHVGWNEVNGQNNRYDAYFVHSYYAELCEQTTAETNYILPFSATLQKENFFGVQFHPEKSAAAGENILKKFLAV